MTKFTTENIATIVAEVQKTLETSPDVFAAVPEQYKSHAVKYWVSGEFAKYRLERFVRGHKSGAAKIVEEIKKCVEVRNKKELWMCVIEDEDELKAACGSNSSVIEQAKNSIKTGCFYVQGEDRNSRPLIVSKFRNIPKAVDDQVVSRGAMFVMDALERRLDRKRAELEKKGVTPEEDSSWDARWNMVMDCGKMQISSAMGRKIGKELVGTMLQFYPERGNKTILIDPDWCVWAILKMIKPFLGAEVREKIVQFSRDKNFAKKGKKIPDFTALVEDRWIDVEYGGAYTGAFDGEKYWANTITRQQRAVASPQRLQGALEAETAAAAATKAAAAKNNLGRKQVQWREKLESFATSPRSDAGRLSPQQRAQVCDLDELASQCSTATPASDVGSEEGEKASIGSDLDAGVLSEFCFVDRAQNAEVHVEAPAVFLSPSNARTGEKHITFPQEEEKSFEARAQGASTLFAGLFSASFAGALAPVVEEAADTGRSACRFGIEVSRGVNALLEEKRLQQRACEERAVRLPEAEDGGDDCCAVVEPSSGGDAEARAGAGAAQKEALSAAEANAIAAAQRVLDTAMEAHTGNAALARIARSGKVQARAAAKAAGARLAARRSGLLAGDSAPSDLAPTAVTITSATGARLQIRGPGEGAGGPAECDLAADCVRAELTRGATRAVGALRPKARALKSMVHAKRLPAVALAKQTEKKFLGIGSGAAPHRLLASYSAEDAGFGGCSAEEGEQVADLQRALASATEAFSPAMISAMEAQGCFRAVGAFGAATAASGGKVAEEKKSDKPFSLFNTKSTYWKTADSSRFQVRQAGYAKSGRKGPSASPVYELVGTDLVKGADNAIGKQALLQKNLIEKLNKHCGVSEIKTFNGLPEFLVVDQIAPTTAGPLFGAHPAGDAGVSVINYFRLSAEARERARTDDLSPQLRLLQTLVGQGRSDKKQACLKLICKCANLQAVAKQHSVPSLVSRFNGKPHLLCSSVQPLEVTGNVLVCEVDMRAWSYLAKSRAVANYGILPDASLEIGLVVEGKTEAELPEQLLGCFQLERADLLKEEVAATVQW